MIRILVIEDEKNIRNFMISVLTAQQYQVISATTGTEGSDPGIEMLPEKVLLYRLWQI